MPEHANKLGWSLGGLTATSLVVLIVTGVVLAQYFNPMPEDANQSVRRTVTDVPLGSFCAGRPVLGRAGHVRARRAAPAAGVPHRLRITGWRIPTSTVGARSQTGHQSVSWSLAGCGPAASVVASGTAPSISNSALAAIRTGSGSRVGDDYGAMVPDSLRMCATALLSDHWAQAERKEAVLSVTTAGLDPAPAARVTDDNGRRPDVVLEARGITKTYLSGVWPRRRSLPVLRGADVTLRTGEIVGLVGGTSHRRPSRRQRA